MTAIWSACRIDETRCVPMMIDDVGQAERMAPMIACSVSVSRALNGSSRTKTSGAAQQRPGERPLALTAGEVSAAWADLGVQAAVSLTGRTRPRPGRGPPQFIVGGVGPADAQIVGDGAGDQRRPG